MARELRELMTKAGARVESLSPEEMGLGPVRTLQGELEPYRRQP